MKIIILFCLLITTIFNVVKCFQIPKTLTTKSYKNVIKMEKDMFAESNVGLKLQSGQLQRERYIASNRFKCREGKGPAFEKRWAERTSRLSKLDGFRFL